MLTTSEGVKESFERTVKVGYYHCSNFHALVYSKKSNYDKL